MCGAKEIYCCQSHCVQPIGWYIVEPCEAFSVANSATTHNPFGGEGWNWNTNACGCSVPRVVKRQRCKHRSCSSCAWDALDSTFTATQQWADTAKEYPGCWIEGQEDYLLLRRTKTKLRNDHELSERQKGKQRAIDIEQGLDSLTSWPSYYETPNALSKSADTLSSLPGASSDHYTNGFLSLLGPDLYPAFEAASAELPQLGFTFEQTWAKGEQAPQISQPQLEVVPQTSDANLASFNFDDPFWSNLFISGGDFSLENGMDIGQTNGKQAHSL